MQLRFVEPLPELAPYVQAIWVCESDTGLLPTARSLAVPNGCPKLIVPFLNSLVSETAERGRIISDEGGVYLVGNRTSATRVFSSLRPTGFVGVEFRPYGAFALLGVPMHETTDRLADSRDVADRIGKRMREAVESRTTVAGMVEELQRILAAGLRPADVASSVVTHCVRAIERTAGQVPIAELQRTTGYSARYLNTLFQRHVGLAPKTLARIARFQRVYRAWARRGSFDTLKAEGYRYYYDQAHFSREFKRLTGFSPLAYVESVPNEFGRTLLTG